MNSRVPLIELYAATLKQLDIFFAKCAGAMVVFLLLNISPDCFQLRSANGEGSIPFLPYKRLNTDIVMYPSRGDRFCFAKDIGQRVSRF